MKISVLRYDRYLTNAHYVDINVEGSIVGEWRKGFAIFRSKGDRYNDSIDYLINENGICICEAHLIHRVIGGFYVVKRLQRYNFRTYPGQDRDTEYDTRMFVNSIYDENGRRLKDNEKEAFLKTNSVQYGIELGNGIILSEKTFYRLDDYSPLFSIDKEVEPIGKFEDGKLRVRVVSDYRDFIVIVYKRKVYRVLEMDDFLFSARILNIDFNIEDTIAETEANLETFEGEKLPPNTVYEDYIPSVETFIEGYYYGFPRKFSMFGIGWDEHYENGGHSFRFVPDTMFFHVGEKWIRILDVHSKVVYDKINSLNNNAPNFIQNIDLIKEDIEIEGEKYDVYRFQCRPYGEVYLDGTFDYDFDIENIKW